MGVILQNPAQFNNIAKSGGFNAGRAFDPETLKESFGTGAIAGILVGASLESFPIAASGAIIGGISASAAVPIVEAIAEPNMIDKQEFKTAFPSVNFSDFDKNNDNRIDKREAGHKLPDPTTVNTIM